MSVSVDGTEVWCRFSVGYSLIPLPSIRFLYLRLLTFLLGPETVDRALIGSNIRRNPRTSTIEFTRIPSNGHKRSEEHDIDPLQKENVIFRIHPTRESSRLIFQLGTASPSLAVQAATLVAPYVVGIDVNAGCPKPFSTSGGMGAALLSTPDLLCSILTALVNEVGGKFEIGISVKIRLLSTEVETRTLVERLCKTGITGLTIHCRTRSMRKTEKAVREQLRMVGEVCREAGVACLMNGDVEDRAQAEQLAAEYGVNGAMIATAAEKNSSVFRQRENGGVAPWKEVVAGYMREALEVENRWGNTKFLLAQQIPGKEQVARSINQAKNYEHTCQILELSELLEMAKEVDKIIGITDRETKSEQKAKKRVLVEQKNKDAGSTKRRKKDLLVQDRMIEGESKGSDFMTDLHQDIIASTVTA